MRRVEIGRFRVTALRDARFALDGGSMFGVVPRSVWEKLDRPPLLLQRDFSSGTIPDLIDLENLLARTKFSGFPETREEYGRLLGFTQGRDDASEISAYLLEEGRWSRLSYPRSGEFKPTGAALLPDGDVILLERRFSLLGGLAARLSMLDDADIRPGALLVPQRIAELVLPLTVDNMEGVATRRGPAGETLVYLISDDNFHALQRTLLLMFALEE